MILGSSFAEATVQIESDFTVSKTGSIFDDFLSFFVLESLMLQNAELLLKIFNFNSLQNNPTRFVLE